MIIPGQLDRQISIQSKAEPVADEGGGFTEDWTDDAVVWAKRADRGGREFRAAGTVMAETDTLWQIRYRSGVTTANRVKAGSFIYDILAVSEIGRRGWLLLQTKFIGQTVSNAIQTFGGEDIETFAGDPITPLSSS